MNKQHHRCFRYTPGVTVLNWIHTPFSQAVGDAPASLTLKARQTQGARVGQAPGGRSCCGGGCGLMPSSPW